MPFFPPGFPPFPFMMPSSSEEKRDESKKKSASPKKKPKETQKKIKIEAENKENKPLFEETGENRESLEEKEEDSEKLSVEDGNHDNMDKKESIRKILKYFMVNIGKIRSNRINAEREKYVKSPCLLQIFDLLMKKYIMSNKTKEEKIKYILRKAFKYLGTKLKRDLNENQIKSKKEFDQIFNEYYMSEKTSLLQKNNENSNENQENITENKSNSKAAPKHKLIFS